MNHLEAGQCPNCNQYKAMSQLSYMWICAASCFALFFVLWWVPILGLVLGLFTLFFVFVGIVGIFVPEIRRTLFCTNCRKTWKKDV